MGIKGWEEGGRVEGIQVGAHDQSRVIQRLMVRRGTFVMQRNIDVKVY